MNSVEVIDVKPMESIEVICSYFSGVNASLWIQGVLIEYYSEKLDFIKVFSLKGSIYNPHEGGGD